MTALLTLPDTAPQRTAADAAAPRMSVVLIAPAGQLGACRSAIERARSQGAAVFTEEIGSDDLDLFGSFAHAIDAISLAVDDATHLFPTTPVVLVGHAAAGIAVRAFSELYPGEIAGVVVTDRSA